MFFLPITKRQESTMRGIIPLRMMPLFLTCCPKKAGGAIYK